MKKQWFKALGLFVLAGIIHMLILESPREMLFLALDRSAFLYVGGLIVGGTSWYYVPGMLCYWLATGKGYMEWGKFSAINIVGVAVLVLALTGSLNPLLIVIMGTIIGLVNSFILCKLVGVRVSKPEEINLEDYLVAEDK